MSAGTSDRKTPEIPPKRKLGKKASANSMGSVNRTLPRNSVPDAEHRDDGSAIAEERLAAEDGQNIQHHAEGGHGKDVYLRVTKGPEQVLVEEGAPSPGRHEEPRLKGPIEPDHRQHPNENRRRQPGQN